MSGSGVQIGMMKIIMKIALVTIQKVHPAVSAVFIGEVSWFDEPRYARASNHYGNTPGHRSSNLGFRLAITVVK